MAPAAGFAVVFRIVLVEFRFIRAHKSIKCHYKGQLYCPFCKIQNIFMSARKDLFSGKIRNKITCKFQALDLMVMTR
jgi:hypothetical protein